MRSCTQRCSITPAATAAIHGAGTWPATTQSTRCWSTRAPQTPGGIGQVLDAPEPENGEADTVAERARDWQIAVEQAETVAKLAGKLPAGVRRSLEAAQAARVDWRELLRR